MFISKKEKTKMLKDIKLLNDAIIDLIGRVMKLEGWERTKTTEKFNVKGNLYKWAKDHPQEPKKRGRPVGSKNKEKA